MVVIALDISTSCINDMMHTFPPVIPLLGGHIERVHKRNVLIIGRTDSGKKTLVREMLGTDTFTESSVDSSKGVLSFQCAEMTMQVCRFTEYCVKAIVINTDFILDHECLNGIMGGIRHDIPEGVHAVLFMFKRNEDDRQFINDLNGFEEIAKVSALVVTACDDLNQESRASLAGNLMEDTSRVHFVRLSCLQEDCKAIRQWVFDSSVSYSPIHFGKDRLCTVQ